MTYAHLFSPAFYGAMSDKGAKRPTTVYSAIRAMPADVWAEMARDVFHTDPDNLCMDDVMDKVIETDTVSNLDSPVTVWIDPEGYYTVDVYDEEN